MARKLENKTNVLAPNGDFPSGDILDDTGVGDGTPMTRTVYSDIHQFFAKVLRDAETEPKGVFTTNDLPENTTNGFQLNEALALVAAFNFQGVTLNGTYDPVSPAQPIGLLREFDGVRMRGKVAYTNVSGTTVATAIPTALRPSVDRKVAIDIFDTGGGAGDILARAHVTITAAGVIVFSDADYPITGNDELSFDGSYYKL